MPLLRPGLAPRTPSTVLAWIESARSVTSDRRRAPDDGIQRVLEAAGVIFTNGHEPGVKLQSTAPAASLCHLRGGQGSVSCHATYRVFVFDTTPVRN
jgi:hypothetical protein